MSKRRIIAGAQVEVTVIVSRCGSWGEDCNMDQVFKQAATNAVGYIRNRTEKDGRLRIVGEPKVTAIMTEHDRV